jgi:EAL domain-containing protein (putative c-di-GMP-specific phosphodiesterase class I)
MTSELARFIADLPAAVALFDLRLRYIAASRDWAAAFGLPRTLYSGRTHDAVSKLAREPLTEVLQRVLAGQGVEQVPVPDSRLPEKSVFSARLHRSSDGTMAGIVVALRPAPAGMLGQPLPVIDPLTGIAERRNSLAEQLRQAFDNGEFALHYHPVMRLADERMVGVEALLRWNHPSEGLVAPGAFLPVLEDSGLILAVGGWIIREAVRQLESWQMLYGRDLVEWIAVNLSARQFSDPTPLLNTLQGIYDGGFSINRLKFEIAEPALTRNPEISRAALAELERLGVRVAIDDFGTGHSSLNSLRDYRVDTIKIDGGFIGQIGTSHGEELVGALLDIAHGYGASVIAEGIETGQQLDFLRRSGCEFGQGYLFAEPMDGAKLGAYALVHAVGGGPAPRTPSGRLAPAFISRPSAGPLPAMSAGAARNGRPET